MNELVRVVVASLTGVPMLVASGGCSADDNPRIVQERQDGDGWASMSLPHRRAGQPTVFADIYLCLDRPGTVRIVDVAVELSQGGFRVEAFATRPAKAPVGTTYPDPRTFDETLSELGYQQGKDTVDSTCDPDNPRAEQRTQVGVQFTKSTNATARGAVIQINYLSGGKKYTYRKGFETVLCEVEQTKPECEAWDYDWSTRPARVVKAK